MSHKQLIDNLASELEAVKPVSLSRWRMLTVLLLTGYLAAVLAAAGLRDDFTVQFSHLVYKFELIVTLILAYGAALMAISLSVPRGGKFPLAWALVILAIALGAGIWLMGQVSLEGLKASIASNHFYITLGVIGCALPVALSLFWLLRQASPTQLAWAGGMALLSASAVGHFLMRCIGQAANFSEVFVWCYSPVIILGFLGMLLGQKLLKW